MRPRVVFGYAGHGDLSHTLRQLAEAHDAEIVTLTLDVGQGRDLEEVRDRALSAGAARAHVLDVREAFARDFVLPALRAGVSQVGPTPLAVALEQALVAQTLVEIATIEAAASIAYDEVGDDRTRLERSLADLDDTFTRIGVPPVTGSAEHAPANLWGRVRATGSPAGTLDTPASVEIAFERGLPVAINGVPMTFAELVESLSTIGARHGVGRMAIPAGDADRARPSRVYDAPAAVMLDAAHRALEAAIVPPELLWIQRDQAVTYAQLVYSGRWFSEARRSMDASSATVQQMVTGTVRIRVFGGELLSSPSVELGSAAVSRS